MTQGNRQNIFSLGIGIIRCLLSKTGNVPEIDWGKKKNLMKGIHKICHANVTTKSKLVNKLCTYFEYFPLEKHGNNCYAVRLFPRKINLYKINT